ncbi:FAD-binding oxidoreductase [Christensenellaceae bacterium OttesenSCG-928-K19]|nr:FAD-binding oxidoreductase [Christensenellaceae bacterium OttesenSCG-928-K19]
MNLDVLKNMLPQDAVSTSDSDLQAYKINDPLATGYMLPSAILKPKNFEELQKIIQTANKEDLKLVIVSSVAPHNREGIGCTEEHVVVDLSGWKLIDGVDRKNLVCRVEPGVTYDELIPIIDKEGMIFPMPLAPKSGKSIVAAILDREATNWPNHHWNSQDPLCSMEFAFGSGEQFRTGSAANNVPVEQLRALGISMKGPNGPGSLGLQRIIQGSQGCMGVVTWATIKLEMKPTISKVMILQSDNLRQIEQFVYDVDHHRWGERQYIFDNHTLAMLMTYKNPGDFDKVKASFKKYICVQEIAGFHLFPEERLEYQTRDIKKIATGVGLKMEEEVGGIAGSDILAAATTPCGQTDWRKSLKGECMSLHMQTTLDRANEYIGIFNAAASVAGIKREEYGVHIQPIVQNSSVYIEFMLPYAAADLEKIRAFEESATKALNANQAFFARPYGTSAKIVWDNDPVSTKLMKQMKGLMDPNRVLCPGKFGL